MLVVDIKLQIFNKVSNFCFTVFTKLPVLFNNTAVTELLLTEFNINHITKINPHFKHKFKLRFTAYEILEIVQQLTDVAELFSTIWEDYGLLMNLPKQN